MKVKVKSPTFSADVGVQMGVGVKVFISSVRRGLETERDALPGLLQALGHQPIAFENFTAQPRPSRKVCMDAVASAEVYVLLLGPEYGDPMEDTGKSPTEEEFAAAKAEGIPILAFHKLKVNFSDEQREFARQVEQYTHGNFRGEFTTVSDLLPKVKLALDELGHIPATLDWQALPVPLTPEPVVVNSTSEYRPALVLSVIPVPSARLSSMQLHGAGQRAERVLRDSGVVSQRAGLEGTVSSDGSVIVRMIEAPVRAGHVMNGRTEGAFGGVAASPNGQLTVWLLLARDFLGSLLDRESLRADLSLLLRVAGQVGAIPSERAALAVAIAPVDGVREGEPAAVGARTSGPMSAQQGRNLQTIADDSVGVSSILLSANEIAEELARRTLGLLVNFR